jgi:subtilisin-like proprotein convertase family protein
MARTLDRWTKGLALALAGGLALTATAPAQTAPQPKRSPEELEAERKVIASGLADRREAVRAIFSQMRGPSANEGGAPANGQPGAQVVYGADDRRDVYQVTDALHQQLAAAAVLIVSISELTSNGDGTYTLNGVRWNTQGGSPLCTDEPFRGQYAAGFCSGFLVGRDVIATAGHCLSDTDFGSVAFVFGFDQRGPGTGAGADPNLIISSQDIYFPSAILGRQLDGAAGLDYTVAQLDRAVVGRQPLRVRRSGEPSAGDQLVMIGHPTGLPKKIEAGGQVQGTASAGFFTANVDAYGGNSGSLVANRSTGVVEGILVRGNTDFTTVGGCTRTRVCADTGCPTFEEISRASTFASFIPLLGVTVDPAAPVLSLGLVGGPFTNNSINYTLTNNSTDPSSFRVEIAPGGSLGLRLNAGLGPIDGTLSSQGTQSFSVSLAPQTASYAAGIYTATVLISDLTNSTTTSIPFTLEVGTTGFTTTPLTGLATGGPTGGPFPGVASYVVTSTRPAPVSVSVVPDQPWISVDNAASQSFVLTGVGDSRTVNVAVGPGAGSLSNGLYTGNVQFTNASGGAGATSRSVAVDVGRYSFDSTDTPIDIPDYTNAPSLISSTITIPPTLAGCVTDVDVIVDITHTYIGDLIVELVGPGGQVVRLHDRSGGGTDNIFATYDQQGGATLPSGPGSLVDFNGSPIAGNWVLRVSDNAGVDVGTLNTWTLKIQTTACPPPRQNLASFDMTTNPGWTMGSGWFFGPPSGTGGDPASAATGANVFGYALGNYTNNISATSWLTSAPINIAGLGAPRLEFKRWLGVERNRYDKAFVDVSGDGITWTNLWTNPDVTIVDTAWQSVSFEIPAALVGSTGLRVRWGLGPTDSSVVYAGWNIDDVLITGYPTSASCPEDYNRDGFRNLDDLGDFITDFYTLPPIPGGVQPNVPQYPGQAVGYGAPCPQAPDAPAPYTANAYRANGYRVGFSPDGSNACPLSPTQSFPNLDNLGDFISAYYASTCG